MNDTKDNIKGRIFLLFNLSEYSKIFYYICILYVYSFIYNKWTAI